MSSVLPARSPFYSFDAETGSRRPRWFAALAGLLALLIVVGGAVLGVSAASAHDKNYDVSCFGLKVVLTNYNTAKPNTVSIKIDGVEQVPEATRTNFGANYTFSTTWNPAVAHSYEIKVRGWDGYNLDASGTQTPCATPKVGLEATQCHTTGGTTDLTATFSGFASYTSTKNGFPSFAPTYTATLLRDGAPVYTVPNAQNLPGGTLTWAGEPAGHTYTFRVTADGVSNAGLTSSVDAKVVACPELRDLSVSVTQCTAVDTDNGSLTANVTVTPGRAYTVVLTRNGTAIQTQNVPATNGTAALTFNFPVAQNLDGLQVVVTDTGAAAGDPNREKKSNVVATKPCPTMPQPTITPSVCTAVDGDLTLTIALDGLTPGRSYTIAIDGTVVETLTAVPTSSIPAKAYPVAAGSHVVTVADVDAPAATKTSDPIEVTDCPTQPDVSLEVTQCTVPGGLGSITASFDGLGVGREYTVTITEGPGNSVPGHTTPLIVTEGAPDHVYGDLDPSKSYTVTIVDNDPAVDVKDAASETLKACPLTPAIELQLQCRLLEGDSLILATIGDLADGAEYDVTVTATTPPPAPAPAAGNQVAPLAVAVIATERITGGTEPSKLQFAVPNNVTYIVTVTNVANGAITNSASIFAAICDLPTFPFPDPELPTLALTGAGDATMPMLGALGLVQFGVALLALAAMLQFRPQRRRTV